MSQGDGRDEDKQYLRAGNWRGGGICVEGRFCKLTWKAQRFCCWGLAAWGQSPMPAIQNLVWHWKQHRYITQARHWSEKWRAQNIEVLFQRAQIASVLQRLAEMPESPWRERRISWSILTTAKGLWGEWIRSLCSVKWRGLVKYLQFTWQSNIF